MKKYALLLILFFCQSAVFPQTKIVEYELMGTDAESGYIDAFLTALIHEPQNKGLIVIYSGADNERLGNILPHIEGIKRYLSLRKLAHERISFVVTRGKKTFFKELWIAKHGEKFPEFKSIDPESIDLELNSLDKRYFYALQCLDCEPSIPELATERVYFRAYAETLKRNENYTALIIIEDGTMFDLAGKNVRSVSSRKYAGQIRGIFTGVYKIDTRRIRIKFAPRAGSATAAYFYIIPKMIENKKKQN